MSGEKWGRIYIIEEDMWKETKQTTKKQAAMREQRVGVRALQVLDKVRTRESILGS